MAFKTAEQIEAERGPREDRELAEALRDHDKRSGSASKRVVGVLAEIPQEKFTTSGKIITLRVREPGRDNPMVGVYFAPDHERRDGFGMQGLDDKLNAMNVGDQVSLAGRWSQRSWKDQSGAERKSWEFMTQRFEKGSVSIEDMEKSARAAILSQSPAADRIDGASASAPAVSAERPSASPTLAYASGNIVDNDAQVLVNTVNSRLSPSGRGVMGKGVALDFANRFPSIMGDYENAIRSGELKPGRALLFDLPDGRKWAALATKDEWRDKSQYGWVESGLKELGEKMREAGLTSVALPPPGCGNGGLDWKKVEPMVHESLKGLDVAMYAKPSGAMEPAAQLSAPGVSSSRQTEMFPESANAKAVAALGGSNPSRSGAEGRRKGWSEDELVAMVPDLLRPRNGYNPYAGIGSRETTQDVSDDMTAVARVLEARGFTLRSGFAGGADTAFELGTKIDSQREIFAPWKGFGSNPESKHEKVRWDQIRRHEGITGERFTPAKARLLEGDMFRRAEELAAPHHPGWDRLPDGHRKLHSRNMGQVFGPKLDVPARFEMAWTVDGKATGGTGQAIRVAEASGIPVLNLHNPRIRAAVLKELGLDPERNLQKDIEAARVERARSEHRDRYEGASMSASMRDSTRQATRDFKQGDPVPAGEAQGSQSKQVKEGAFDLATPAVRSRHKDDVASFCKVADPLGTLSNMHNRQPLVVDGVTWKSSEALYQALRFPHNPELQERIRNESNAYTAKILAHEHKAETRPDWNEVNEHAMAWVVTLKKDQSAVFREDLDSTKGRDIVELSVKDDFWGAKPKGDQLVGRDVLGNILTQLRDGARMDEPPPGSMLLGRPIGQSVDRSEAVDLPDPSIKASMYFNFGGQKREGIESASTFDAINAGERTSTTRFPAWGSLERWEKLEPGSVVRFYEDKDMRGKSVDVVVTGTDRIDLSKASNAEIAAWSKAEGWSEQAGRDFGRKYGEGVQIRYALPDSPEGRAALDQSRGAAASQETAKDVVRESEPVRSARPSPAQVAAMTDKQKWLSALG